jgi:hypothetical protein
MSFLQLLIFRIPPSDLGMVDLSLPTFCKCAKESAMCGMHLQSLEHLHIAHLRHLLIIRIIVLRQLAPMHLRLLNLILHTSAFLIIPLLMLSVRAKKNGAEEVVACSLFNATGVPYSKPLDAPIQGLDSCNFIDSTLALELLQATSTY